MLLLTLSCAYEAPFVPYGDHPETVVLSGDVVLTSGSASVSTFDTGGDAIARRVGHVVVYGAEDPPPFGSPVALATIASAEWGSGSGPRLGTTAEGVVSAPWAITGLDSGTYVVTALVDNDGDFNPFFSDFAGGATCGDQIGAYVLDTDQEILPISVEAPDHVDGLSVLVGAALPYERPAFTLGAMGADTLPHLDLVDNVFKVHDFEFDLDSTGIAHPLLELNDPDAEDCPTDFTVIARDKDGDGVADGHAIEAAANLGALDMYPVVVLRHVLNEDGSVPEQTTISQALIDFRPNAEAGANPSPFQRAQAHSEDWTIPATMVPNIPYSTTRLPLLWTGQAVPVLEDGSYGEALSGADVPTGTWSLQVVNHTGQTWTTPNSLSSEELWGDAAIASQAAMVGVLPDE